MAYFSVKTAGLIGQIPEEINIMKQTANLADSVESIANSLDSYLSSSSVPIIKSNLKVVASQMRSESAVAGNMSSALVEIINKYESTENSVVGNAGFAGEVRDWLDSVDQIIKDRLKQDGDEIDDPVLDEILKHVPEELVKKIKEAIAKAQGKMPDGDTVKKELGKLAINAVKKLGPVGAGVAIISNIATGAYDWGSGAGWSKLLKDGAWAAESTAKAVSEWKGWTDLLNITAKDPKTFTQGWKSYWDKFNVGKATNTSGKVAAVCKWAGAALTFITEGFENFNDKENSTGRAVMETIGEASFDILETAAIGAAIGSIIPGAGTVVGAAVAVVGTVVVKWGADLISKAITGKDLGEFVSDTIIDNVVEPVIDGVKKVGEAIGDGVKAVTGAVKTAWSKVGSFFSLW